MQNFEVGAITEDETTQMLGKRAALSRAWKSVAGDISWQRIFLALGPEESKVIAKTLAKAKAKADAAEAADKAANNEKAGAVRKRRAAHVLDSPSQRLKKAGSAQPRRRSRTPPRKKSLAMAIKLTSSTPPRLTAGTIARTSKVIWGQI